jgi:YD repeat-containing protein
MDGGFNYQVYQATPFIWGSQQTTTGLTFVYQGVPFFVVSGPPGVNYTYDSLGRLTEVTYTNGTTITYNYDAMGNRTSVVTVCGPNGC